jgi:hypothetical protein
MHCVPDFTTLTTAARGEGSHLLEQSLLACIAVSAAFPEKVDSAEQSKW